MHVPVTSQSQVLPDVTSGEQLVYGFIIKNIVVEVITSKN